MPAGGGWSNLTADKVKAVRVPDKIKCSGCHLIVPSSQFSSTQLTKVKGKIAMFGANAIHGHKLRCENCTGGGVPVGITCSRCHEDKPYASYTKVQRRDTERAMCRKCASEIQMLQTWAEESKDIADDEFTVVYDTASTVGKGSTVETESTIGKSSTVGKSVYSDDGFSNAEDYQSLAGGVWLEPATPLVHAEQENSPVAREESLAAVSFTGWGSTTLMDDMDKMSISSSKAQSHVSTPKDLKENKKWAKVKSHDPFRDARIMGYSDPTTRTGGVLLPVDEEEQNESVKTISGTKVEKKTREEIGRTRKAATAQS